MGKTIWTSKTFYVNLLAVGYAVFQMVTGSEAALGADKQILILGVVNWVLRMITKDPIVWE